MQNEADHIRTKKFVQVRLDEDTIIRIEATEIDEPQNGDVYVSTPSLPSFQDITKIIKGISKEIVSVWQEVKPHKATVEFGMEVGVEPGKVTALLVQGSGKANFHVTLEWGDQEPTYIVKQL